MSPTPPRPSFDIAASQSRTKEENQERAFIAASRRKDRSLDARVESANRASILHKKRTGRALHITREIVAAEAMYEEIDDNYRQKIRRYMHDQNRRMSGDFDDSLLVGLQMPNFSKLHLHTPQAHHRRASSVTPSGPIHGARKLSLDLSQLRTSLPGPRTDPSNLMSSASGHFSPSYMGPVPAQAQTPAQAPSYVASEAPTFAMNPSQQQMQTWETLFPGHSMSSSTPLGGLPMAPGQFRNRIASAPTIPVQAQVQAQAQAQAHAGIPTPDPVGPRGTSQHARVRSEPGQVAIPTPTPSSASSVSFHTGIFPNSSSSISDPSSSSELLPTPRSGSPHTPPSQASKSPNSYSTMELPDPANDSTKWASEELQSLNFHPGIETYPQQFDQDFLDFSHFASTLDHNQCEFSFSLPMAVDSGNLNADVGFGDGPDMREYITNI
ncbi:hypothetical protein BDW62DRAFT_197728 [Aspergillus aurantiobrunneus]